MSTTFARFVSRKPRQRYDLAVALAPNGGLYPMAAYRDDPGYTYTWEHPEENDQQAGFMQYRNCPIPDLGLTDEPSWFLIDCETTSASFLHASVPIHPDRRDFLGDLFEVVRDHAPRTYVDLEIDYDWPDLDDSYTGGRSTIRFDLTYFGTVDPKTTREFIDRDRMATLRVRSSGGDHTELGFAGLRDLLLDRLGLAWLAEHLSPSDQADSDGTRQEGREKFTVYTLPFGAIAPLLDAIAASSGDSETLRVATRLSNGSDAAVTPTIEAKVSVIEHFIPYERHRDGAWYGTLRPHLNAIWKNWDCEIPMEYRVGLDTIRRPKREIAEDVGEIRYPLSLRPVRGKPTEMRSEWVYSVHTPYESFIEIVSDRKPAPIRRLAKESGFELEVWKGGEWPRWTD